MEKPRPRSNGRPKCSDQILYILNMNDGKQKRSVIREELKSMGYAQDCYFQAFKTLERQNKIEYEGSSRSSNQIVFLTRK